ncbi:C40 family peptidase [Pseudomonadota bacterium]|nr:C40 family peptidase [Pseudomonadota bacterium]
MNIIKSSADMKSNMTGTSSLETECLFGEKVEILKEHLDWVYCKLLTDNYCGWIKKNNLGLLKKATHRVIVKGTFIYKNKNAKSEALLYLPMGSNLAIEKVKSGWAQTFFYLDDKIQVGYVPSKHIVYFEHKVKDWVAIAQQLEGTPYKWGGRNSIGVDCSALLQLSYQTYGQIIPRNSSQQVNLVKKNVDNVNDLQRGCVIFWEGHVGIMIDKLNCIHANAFHMKTISEPLINIINRMDKSLKIIKMMNFN